MSRKCQRSVATERRLFTKSFRCWYYTLAPNKNQMRYQWAKNVSRVLLQKEKNIYKSFSCWLRQDASWLTLRVNSMDTTFDWISGFHLSVFAQREYIISCFLFSILPLMFVAFVCVLYSHVVQDCLYQITWEMNMIYPWFSCDTVIH